MGLTESGKNNNRISWDKTWIDIARIISQRTSCIKFQVGCVLVSTNNRHCVLGYNGSPSGAPNCCEVGCAKNAGGRCRGCHAEINTIINCHGSPGTFEGGTAYVTIFPCNDCAKALCQAGIKRVVYADDYPKEQNDGLYVFFENNVRVEKWDETKKCTTIIRSDNSNEISLELKNRAYKLIGITDGCLDGYTENQKKLKRLGVMQFATCSELYSDAILLTDKHDIDTIYDCLVNQYVAIFIITRELMNHIKEGQFTDIVDFIDRELIPIIARGIQDSLYQR